MNEHVFGPHHPDWTAGHQAASEPTGRELLLIKQRDEARALAEKACRKYNELLEENRKVTCAFCGEDYPEGTPTSQDAALTAHIETCPKHPLRQARAQAEMWRSKVVWCFSEEEIPRYIQGKAGENEICSELTADEANAMTKSIVELREALRALWYLRVPTGMKLEEMLLDLGHQSLWMKIQPLVEPA